MKETSSKTLVAALFSFTSFLSAALLFSIQPMVAKMLLPLLGGTPAVWNTCLVFFQAALLAGYAYAHFGVLRLTPPLQKLAHLVLLLVAFLFLPIHLSAHTIASIPYDRNPAPWLLGGLLSLVGMPFFLVSSSAPILQQWFARTSHPRAHDPYFLYAASNLGSLMALLAYPSCIEPLFTLPKQSLYWAGMYGLLVLSFLGCMLASWHGRDPSAADRKGKFAPASDLQRTVGETDANVQRPGAPINWRRRIHWVFLAFLPSSLMLGVTNHLSTDIAAIPLLWILPLALYLLTFIIAFSQRPPPINYGWDRAVAISALALLYVILSQATQPISLILLAHFVVFFILAFFCHSRLSGDRPATDHLTEYYLWISVGGVLGGLFNSILAPNVFKTVIEYPLVLVLCCLFRPKARNHSSSLHARLLDWALPLVLGVATAVLAYLKLGEMRLPIQTQIAVVFGIPLILNYFFVQRPTRFALGILAVFLSSWFYVGPHGRTLHIERNFFGVARVTLDPATEMHRLVHGTTIHGKQSLVPTRQCEPLSYYSPAGPVGLVFKVLNSRPAPHRVAVTGLGAGSMAAYSLPDQDWTYYEIDPAVISIAQDTNYFSYLKHCAAGKVTIVPGDARLRLREAPPRGYGLIVMDAFSSDSIPTHLLTREALDLYLSKLADGGLLLFHISNRYLDLRPVLADLALNAGLVAYYRADLEIGGSEMLAGIDPSEWVVMARQPSDLGAISARASIWARLASEPDWQPLTGRPGSRVWSDDFSNLLSIFKWR